MANRLSTVDQLAREFSKMPTIGRRTAQKLAFYVLKMSPTEAEHLVHAVREVKRKIRSCERCFNVTEAQFCGICTDTKRDTGLICVVEAAADIAAIEKSATYRGTYHVLGGALSPLDGIEADDLKIEELLARVVPGVCEVILATNPSTEGEATALYLSRLLQQKVPMVTRIALGLPMGTELEFSDDLTLAKALAGRIAFK